MALLGTIFNEFFSRPLFNTLIVLYNILPGGDFGLAIITLTLGIRILLFPLSQKAITSQRELATLQPQIKEIQEKYKNDKEKQSRSIMELYQKHRVNPFSGCLPLLIQFPVFIALYQVFLKGLDAHNLSLLYSFVSRPETIHPYFLGLINLSAKSSESIFGIALAVGAAIGAFVQAKTMTAKNPPVTKGTGAKAGQDDFSKAFQNQMTYAMPLFTIFILWNLPAGLGLYWFTSTLIGLGQQLLPFPRKPIQHGT